MRWWCSGQVAVPWDWAPQPYLGVWLVMIGLAGAYVVAIRRWERDPNGAHRTRGQVAAAVTGWLVLWVATDWPVGKLAAGYLLAASMVQIILYTYVVAPLFVYALPRPLREAWLARSHMRCVRAVVQRPLAAFGLLNLSLIVTHVPAVTDTLKALQAGTMAMDAAWLVSAFLFWWALDVSREESPSVRFGKRILYLVGSRVVPTLLGALLTFHNFPLYETYEFTNRVWPEFTALDDQQAAGLLMWMGMTPLLLLRQGITFHDWYSAEEAEGTIER